VAEDQAAEGGGGREREVRKVIWWVRAMRIEGDWVLVKDGWCRYWASCEDEQIQELIRKFPEMVDVGFDPTTGKIVKAKVLGERP